MLIAITRTPGPELANCELTHLERQPINVKLARRQHWAHLRSLRRAGVHVFDLAADPNLPDGVFVEDTAVVLDELAVIASPARASRRGETDAVEGVLRAFLEVVRLPGDGCLEGGDVLRMGRNLFVGQSGRTNAAGIEALEAIVRPLGYSVIPVSVRGCLHLKTACCAVDAQTLLINRAWVDGSSFSGLRLVDVPAEEAWGANVLALPDRVFVSSAYPRTIDLVRGMGHTTIELDISELHKAEAGLTCMSLVFHVDPPARQ